MGWCYGRVKPTYVRTWELMITVCTFILLKYMYTLLQSENY